MRELQYEEIEYVAGGRWQSVLYGTGVGALVGVGISTMDYYASNGISGDATAGGALQAAASGAAIGAVAGGSSSLLAIAAMGGGGAPFLAGTVGTIASSLPTLVSGIATSAEQRYTGGGSVSIIGK